MQKKKLGYDLGHRFGILKDSSRDVLDWAHNQFLEQNKLYLELKELVYKMDKQIRKIEKTIKKDTKKEEKQLSELEKADKKRDKECEYGKKMLKKRK